MTEWGGRWLDRLGQVAAATVTPSQPEPIYGAAVDIATAPLTPQQYEDAVNAIQTVADDKHAQQMAVQQELTPAQRDAADGDDDDGFSPLDLVPFGDKLGEGLDKVGNAVGSAWDSLSGVDEKTGLNRAERKWLEAQANQDSDIRLQNDTELFPELRGAAAAALKSGEWNEQLAEAYAKYQGSDLTGRTLGAIENFYQEEIARPTSAAFQSIGLAKGDDGFVDVGTLLSDETWRQSWERSEHITPGQAAVETTLASVGKFDPKEAYPEGFDEFGNPLNQAYYDLRKGAAYNVASGASDFAMRWYADPLAIGGKTVGVARAITKADWDRIPAAARARMERITTAPAERFEEVAATVPKTDIVGQRAIKVRRDMDRLTAQVRQDPQKFDEVWLAENVPAFRDDLLGAGYFREAALIKRKQFNPATGKMEDVLANGKPVFDDEVRVKSVAALMGNGKARAELADLKELDDMLTAITQDSLDSVNGHLSTMKAKYDEALEVAQREHPSQAAGLAWETTFNTRNSIREMSTRADELKGQLAEYDTYHRFMDALLDSPDAAALRLGQFKPKPRRGRVITSYTLRPSRNSNVAVTATVVPRAPWLKRSNAIDLSGHGSLQEQAPRIFNEIAKASDIDTLTAVSIDKGFAGGFEEAKREFLNQAARARTDVERRAVAQRIENFGVDAVAAKHGLTKDEALATAMQLQGKRGELFAEARRQAEQAKAMGIADDDVRRYTYAEGSTVNETDFPISLTQLQNYFVPIGVRDLDRFLTRHGEALKNSFRSKLYKAGDIGTDALELFNSFWKPAVLFRLGYPIRTVSDESFRIMAHTGSWQHLLGDLPRAMGVGIVNTGKRVGNRTARHFPALAKARGARFQVRDQAQVYGDDITVGGHEFSGALSPGRGDLYERIVSSAGSQDRLYKSYKANLNKLHGANLKTRKTLEGEDGHAAAWQYVLNNQVANDPIWLKMLAGESDDDIIRWLRRDPKGREAARRNPRRGSDPEQWVDEMRRELDTLADDDVLRAKLLNKEEITVDELQQIINDTGRSSPVAIDEAAIQLVSGKGQLAETLNGFVEQGYRVLAQIPSDVLARNPFFARQYRSHLARQVESLPDGFVLSAKQTAAFERQAREFALKQVRRYLFNLADETDLVHYMRFMSPFMGAWKETMTSWSRIFTENPEAIGRMWFNGWQSMDDLFFVEMVDQNGRTADDPEHGELDRLRVPLPGAAVAGLKKLGIGDVETVTLDKQTLATTLQGNPPWLPGSGPVVQYTASKVLGDRPDFADENRITAFLHKYLFPIGVPRDALDAALPTLGRRIRRFVEGTEDPVFANLATLLYKSEVYEWEQNGRIGPRPDPLEAKDKAGVIQAIYVASAVGMPFSFQFEGGNQFFVDRANQLREELGFEEGYKRFIEEYGEDAYLFWYSNSKSKTGVPPTSEGFKMSKQQRELLERYPDIGLAIVGLDTQDAPFNYAVHQEQHREGDREHLGVEGAVAKAEAQQGWEEFRQFNVAIEAELAARGLTSLQQKDAQDLAYMKRLFVDDLRHKYPGWSRDYDEIDRGKSYAIVDQFRQAAQSGDLADRPEWEGIAEYIEIHDAVAMELDARRANGGSANITVEDNADLEFIFEMAVGELRQRNLMFADVYTRFLDNHTLTNGSNGGL